MKKLFCRCLQPPFVLTLPLPYPNPYTTAFSHLANKVSFPPKKKSTSLSLLQWNLPIVGRAVSSDPNLPTVGSAVSPDPNLPIVGHAVSPDLNASFCPSLLSMVKCRHVILMCYHLFILFHVCKLSLWVRPVPSLKMCGCMCLRIYVICIMCICVYKHLKTTYTVLFGVFRMITMLGPYLWLKYLGYSIHVFCVSNMIC